MPQPRRIVSLGTGPCLILHNGGMSRNPSPEIWVEREDPPTPEPIVFSIPRSEPRPVTGPEPDLWTDILGDPEPSSEAPIADQVKGTPIETPTEKFVGEFRALREKSPFLQRTYSVLMWIYGPIIVPLAELWTSSKKKP